jgi:hypothetical protein
LREEWRRDKKLEFRWKFPDDSEVIIHHPFGDYYASSAANCWNCDVGAFYNVLFETQMTQNDSVFRYNAFSLIGGDFHFQNAEPKFRFLDHIMSLYPNVNYATFNDYVKDFDSSPKDLHTITEDLFPYGNDLVTLQNGEKVKKIWTGYFSTKPRIKHRVRRLGKLLRSVRNLASTKFFQTILSKEDKKFIIEKLLGLGEDFGTFLHHDAITGTSKDYVDTDYFARMDQIEKGLDEIMSKLAKTHISMCDFNDLMTKNRNQCEYLNSFESTNKSSFAIFNPHLFPIFQEYTLLIPLTAGKSNVLVQRSEGGDIRPVVYCWEGQDYCEVSFFYRLNGLSVEHFQITLSTNHDENRSEPSQRRRLFEIIRRSHSTMDQWPERPNNFRVVESNRTNATVSAPIVSDGGDSSFIDPAEDYEIRDHKLVPIKSNGQAADSIKVDTYLKNNFVMGTVVINKPELKYTNPVSDSSNSAKDPEETRNESIEKTNANCDSHKVSHSLNRETTNSSSDDAEIHKLLHSLNENNSSNHSPNKEETIADSLSQPNDVTSDKSATTNPTNDSAAGGTTKPKSLQANHQPTNPLNITNLTETIYKANFIIEPRAKFSEKCIHDFSDKQVFSLTDQNPIVVCKAAALLVISNWSVIYYSKPDSSLPNAIYYTTVDAFQSGHYSLDWHEHPELLMYNRILSVTTLDNHLFWGVRIHGEHFNYTLSQYLFESFYRIESDVYNKYEFNEGFDLLLNIRSPVAFNDSVFYSDSNGLFEMTRTKHTRLEAVVSPVASFLHLNSSTGNTGMYVFNDRSQSGFGIDSTARFIIQRSAKIDDGKGVNQILSVNEKVKLTHLVYNYNTENVSEREEVLTLIRNRLDVEVPIFFMQSQSIPFIFRSINFDRLNITKSLRMTTQFLDIKRILVRFQNIKRSAAIEVELKPIMSAVFDNVDIMAVDFDYPFSANEERDSDSFKPVSQTYKIEPLQYYSFVLKSLFD